jgi:L-lysine 6-transaminase
MTTKMMDAQTSVSQVTPETVHEVLARTILADGFDMVVDLEKSKGNRLWDSRGERWLLDLFSFFATSPLGTNHPKMTEPAFAAKMARLAIHNPTNSDIYSVEMAEFVDTFRRLAMPEQMVHAFFVAGGTLGVENALKAAFDWKVKKNWQSGKVPRGVEKGHQVIHFREAFHGRSGYTLSMTNTADPRKHALFPKFPWPRITNPKVTFPLTGANLTAAVEAERQAIDEIKAAFHANPDDIAAIIIEPIQGEGGDNHFRPEFVRALRQLADENDAMFIVDEVQSGLGMTGKMWAIEHAGVMPDMIAFGKKTQVCGFMSTKRIEEIEDNVFTVSSRLNSTWGGTLIDMVRCQRYLEVMYEDDLLANTLKVGAYLTQQLTQLASEFPALILNPRGLGLMCAFSLPDGATRDAMTDKLYANGVVLLGSGPTSIRFRPPLTLSQAEVDEAMAVLRRVASEMAKSS